MGKIYVMYDYITATQVTVGGVTVPIKIAPFSHEGIVWIDDGGTSHWIRGQPLGTPNGEIINVTSGVGVSIDQENAYQQTQVFEGTDAVITPIWSGMLADADTINSHAVSYLGVLGPNSNTVAHAILNDAGISPPDDNLALPGAEMTLSAFYTPPNFDQESIFQKTNDVVNAAGQYPASLQGGLVYTLKDFAVEQIDALRDIWSAVYTGYGALEKHFLNAGSVVTHNATPSGIAFTADSSGASALSVVANPDGSTTYGFSIENEGSFQATLDSSNNLVDAIVPNWIGGTSALSFYQPTLGFLKSDSETATSVNANGSVSRTYRIDGTEIGATLVMDGATLSALNSLHIVNFDYLTTNDSQDLVGSLGPVDANGVGQSLTAYTSGNLGLFANVGSVSQHILTFGPNEASGDLINSFDYRDIANGSMMFAVSNAGTVVNAYTAILNGGTATSLNSLNPNILFSGATGVFADGYANVPYSISGPAKTFFSLQNFHAGSTINNKELLSDLNILNGLNDPNNYYTVDVVANSGTLNVEILNIVNVQTTDVNNQPITNTTTIIAYDNTYSLIPYQGFTPENFYTALDGQGGIDILTSDQCFRSGTGINTPDGYIPVERLVIGDHVLTFSDEPTIIKWIGRRRVNCRRHPNPRAVWPVRVVAGAFGKNMPHDDLWLSPDHAVFVNDVLIPIKHLLNGVTIDQVPMDEVTYYHIELPQHDVLVAEGLPAESYLDTGDRSSFSNGGKVAALHPDFSARKWEAKGCAPLIVTGPILTSVRVRLLQRAATHASQPTTAAKASRAA